MEVKQLHLDPKKEKNYPLELSQDSKHALDRNHTHFLLVDDAAYRKGISDTETNFVVNFLDSFSEKTGENKDKIVPVVTVAFDEKVNTIKTIIRNIKSKLLCVMITVSGLTFR